VRPPTRRRSAVIHWTYSHLLLMIERMAEDSPPGTCSTGA
jgi:hypothetical protein